MSGKKIKDGLKSAIAYAKGDKSKGRATKFHVLKHEKHGIRGVTSREPKPRKQDKEFVPMEAYAVVFFPKYDLGYTAQFFPGQLQTISRTIEGAEARFMDELARDTNFKHYESAGHMVRRVKIIDLGPARSSKPAKKRKK